MKSEDFLKRSKGVETGSLGIYRHDSLNAQCRCLPSPIHSGVYHFNACTSAGVLFAILANRWSYTIPIIQIYT